MIQKMFTVYDNCASAYLTPYFMPQTEMAERIFEGCVNDPTHLFGRFPAHFTLFLIGTWDDESATFLHHAPSSIGNGVEYINQQSADEDQPPLQGLTA